LQKDPKTITEDYGAVIYKLRSPFSFIIILRKMYIPYLLG